MLSATPHDGKARSFASLVNMLDATAITNPDDSTKEDFRPGLVIRRFKKDVQEQVRDAFRDRQVFPQGFPASTAEEAAYDALLAVRIAGRRHESATRDLFAVTLEKALFSSPAACIETVDERIRRREREISNGEDASSRKTEIASLTALRDSLARIGPADYSKYQALLDAIQGGQPFNWHPTETTDRLVIFTERIATLNWLNDRLATDLMLEPGQVETLHGGMNDVEQQRVVEDFGNTQRPVRLLLCSDVASEGINLHYQCHRLMHFDMPWSLMVFQQRNGRVDRYGQTATPQIVYLVTESANPTIRDDTRILEVLMAKDEQAYRNIGDPSVFMDVITCRIFGQRHPARWVILLSPSQVLLLERGKWTHNRLLRFVFDDIMGRRETPTLQATAALLHRESLVPAEGMGLLDSLDDNSHRHAFAVSTDLKHALRESIELIGNEAIRYLREVRKERVYRLDDKLAGKLGQEALRYMYRLLFLFYIEARPEFGYAPVDSEAHRKGYSLEHLRDLELVRLTGGESLNGYYIHESVQTLFRLIRDGFDGGDPNILAGSLHNTFQIRALDSALFRADATPLLDGVKLRNEVLQQVIRLMSLTRPAKGRSHRRGRISYAQLGINQLGAVYEALLSYRGFFAEEDLYEVKQAGKDPGELENAWLVPLSELHKYSQEERVFEADADGLRKLKVHPRGRFIYRLAGRDREETASYYTPESLTRCVVKYALKELIPDDMPASRILELTICEPAMGSAAFLNEAVNQLAEKYLDRRQRELGKRIPHAEYADELQKVKHFITDRNVFGVGLNPVAVELAEVSLWLNCIHKDGHVPWFGFQLVCGNSLVGARRQVYESAKLGQKVRRGDRWCNFAPERVTATGSGMVYHFLLPDPGMADYRNKAAMRYEAENFARIREWRKVFCQSFTAEEIAELEALSARVDELWALHTEQLARDRLETEDTLRMWERPGSCSSRWTPNDWKDRIHDQGVFSVGTRTVGPYRRLKLVMDYWCALWFWPIGEAARLPTRDEFLNEVSPVLKGSVFQPGLGPNQTEDLFGQEYVEHAEEIAKRITNEIGMLDLDRLFDQFPRLKLVEEMAERRRFHHWELVFADLFYGRNEDGGARGGFDLVLGNPPWIKVRWTEGGVLGDFDPSLALRKHSAVELMRGRDEAFERHGDLRKAWMADVEDSEATQVFLNATQNYPALAKQQTNLFKCFLPQAWMIGGENGAAGFLHLLRDGALARDHVPTKRHHPQGDPIPVGPPRHGSVRPSLLAG